MAVGTQLFHLNVNCADLDRSLAFYEGFGFRRTVRTTTDVQPARSLGLDEGAWDAWILADARPMADRVVLDLLEWHHPRPTGAPPAPTDLGYNALLLESPAGDPPALDPDGTALVVSPADSVRFAGVRLGCSDLARSLAFWTDVVGLRPVDDHVLADGRGPDAFAVELVQAPAGAAPASAQANRLGPYRMALLTDSIADDVRTVDAAGAPRLSDPERLAMGGELPDLLVVSFLDPDGAVVELIQNLG